MRSALRKTDPVGPTATARLSTGGSQDGLEIGGVHYSARDASAASGPLAEVPTPGDLLAASLATSTAASMETYAKRHGWDMPEVVVEVDYQPSLRGSPTRCGVLVRLPEQLDEQQRECLMRVAAKSPVHRTLDGEILFDERLELIAPEAAPAQEQRVRQRAGRRRPKLSSVRNRLRQRFRDLPGQEPRSGEL